MTKNVFVITKGSIIPEYDVQADSITVQNLCTLTLQDGDRICTHTEACLEVIHSRLEDGKVKRAIDLLKNKFSFRTAIQEAFPNFEFYQTTLEDLQLPTKKLIIKPTKGFFSAGVRVLEPHSDLAQIKKELTESLAEYRKYFSDAVLSKNTWLVEEYIAGEEIAVDMYFAEDGSPVILNITHHPIPKDPHYLNAIYWTHEKLFEKWLSPLEDFFHFLNTEVLHVTNFPIHAEFRIHQNELIPIELNPMRFGGFGLADLSFYGLGFNPYDFFFQNQKPDWKAIWATRKDQYICWTLAYNGKGVDISQNSPSYSAFADFCGLNHLIYLRPLDFQKQPVFAIAYLALDHPDKITEILNVDFSQFFSATSAKLHPLFFYPKTFKPTPRYTEKLPYSRALLRKRAKMS